MKLSDCKLGDIIVVDYNGISIVKITTVTRITKTFNCVDLIHEQDFWNLTELIIDKFGILLYQATPLVEVLYG